MVRRDGGWCVVWCHERCFKDDNASRRKELVHGAAQYGATTVFLKKAKRFEMWCADNPGRRVLLITDWREAQPCSDAILQSGCPAPALTVVACESEKQHQRASAWAAALPPEAGAVQTFQRTMLTNSIWQGLLESCMQLSPQIASSEPSTTAWRSPPGLEQQMVGDRQGFAWQFRYPEPWVAPAYQGYKQGYNKIYDPAQSFGMTKEDLPAWKKGPDGVPDTCISVPRTVRVLGDGMPELCQEQSSDSDSHLLPETVALSREFQQVPRFVDFRRSEAAAVDAPRFVHLV
eukprot:gb/GFBE01059503.1/.p1 GENE.gb/GFBE01059503.1/~~gb/GFBE01059503.1/.p1  ORF type:complete len:289 (+),score=42.79 gb/GFBE01059503.1/:1-867(+)